MEHLWNVYGMSMEYLWNIMVFNGHATGTDGPEVHLWPWLSVITGDSTVIIHSINGVLRTYSGERAITVPFEGYVRRYPKPARWFMENPTTLW